LGDFYTGAGHPPRIVHDPALFAPNMTFLGRVSRYVPYKDKRLTDRFVKEWMLARGLKFDEKYRMCHPLSHHMSASIAKYNKVQPILDDSLWDEAGVWTEKHFAPFMSNSSVVSLDKAVGEADRSTSAGYPWSLWFKNKDEFLNSDAFPRVMEQFWDSLATDKPFTQLWVCSLKRELRSVEKLEKGSIRTFTASPTEGSIACNRLCLDANEKFYVSNNKTWSFVGCSKYNLGFHRLYTRLNAHPNAFALDESAYDSSLFRAAMFGQRDLRWRMLRPIDRTPENRQRLWNIYDQIVESVIVLDDGSVYQKHTGNPSGSANTIVDNTMILFRLLAYAWLVSTKTDKLCEYSTYNAFMKNVEAALNGDDNTFTVSNEAVKFFNARAIAKIWSEIGVTTKTDVWEPRKLSDVDFLSHTFVQINDVWLPKPEREKVLCSALYANEVDDVRFTMLRLFALRLESWADIQTRNEIADCIAYIRDHYAMDLNGVVIDRPFGQSLTWKDIQSVWKTDHEIWRLFALPVIEPGMRVGESSIGENPERYVEVSQPSVCCLQTKRLVLRKCQRCGCETVSYDVSTPYYCLDCIQAIFHARYGTQPVGVALHNACQCCYCLLPADERDPEMGHCDCSDASPVSELNSPRAADMPSKQKGARSRKNVAKANNKGARKAGKKKGKKGRKGGGIDQLTEGKRYNAPVSSGTVRTTRGARSPPTRITHRESLGTLTPASTAYAVLASFNVNPGLPASFPWLSNIAQQYETYRFRKLRYCYETRSSTANAGIVILVTNYDVTEAVFTSTVQAENYRGATVGQPWISFCHDLATGSMNDYNRHYCRSGAQVSGTDLKTYDVGLFQLIVSGCPNSQIGELYVEYDVDLFDPRVQVPIGQFLPSAHIVSSAAGATAAAPFGTGAVIRSGGALAMTASGTTLTFPAVGQYVVIGSYISGTISMALAFSAGSNCTALNLMNNNANSALGAVTSNTGSVAVGVFSITAPNGTVTMSGGGTYTGGNTDIWVCQTSSGLLAPMPPTASEYRIDMSTLEARLALLEAKHALDRKDEKSVCGVEHPATLAAVMSALKEGYAYVDASAVPLGAAKVAAPVFPNTDLKKKG